MNLGITSARITISLSAFAIATSAWLGLGISESANAETQSSSLKLTEYAINGNSPGSADVADGLLSEFPGGEVALGYTPIQYQRITTSDGQASESVKPVCYLKYELAR
jgi:hypothetical protein